jgi:hypothetical protein
MLCIQDHSRRYCGTYSRPYVNLPSRYRVSLDHRSGSLLVPLNFHENLFEGCTQTFPSLEPRKQVFQAWRTQSRDYGSREEFDLQRRRCFPVRGRCNVKVYGLHIPGEQAHRYERGVCIDYPALPLFLLRAPCQLIRWGYPFHSSVLHLI